MMLLAQNSSENVAFAVRVAVVGLVLYLIIRFCAWGLRVSARKVGARRRELESVYAKLPDDKLVQVLEGAREADGIETMAALNVAEERIGASPALRRAITALQQSPILLIRRKAGLILSRNPE